jgi:hypothetical protein
MIKSIIFLFSLILILPITSFSQLVHDAEYYVIEAQNGEKWAKDDESIDKKLADFREKNNGKAPNIIFSIVHNLRVRCNW